jgi:hypothetical protein
MSRLLRLIPRRRVLAFIALHGTEATMPKQIGVREYHYDGQDWRVVALEVEDQAAVQFWAEQFGHDEKRFRANTYTRDDGTQWTKYSSGGVWHAAGPPGIRAEVEANVDEETGWPPPPKRLAEVDDEQLREIAHPATPDAGEVG